MNRTKRISMGVLAAVIVVTPIIAVSCGKDSQKDDELAKQSRKEKQANKAEQERLAREKKEAAEKAAKEAAKKAAEKAAKDAADQIKERDAQQIKTLQSINEHIREYFDDFDYRKPSPLKKASELAKEIHGLTELNTVLNFWYISQDVRDYMKANVKATGNSNGTITIIINLITEGATNPKSKPIKITIYHINDVQVEKNVRADNDKKAKEEVERQKLYKHIIEMEKLGFRSIGHTNEVWIKDEKDGTITLLDEYKGRLDFREATNNKRYQGYTQNAQGTYERFSYLKKANKIIMNNVTRVESTNYLKDWNKAPILKEIEMRNLTELSHDEFTGFTLEKVIVPNLKQLEDEIFGLPVKSKWEANYKPWKPPVMKYLDISGLTSFVERFHYYNDDKSKFIMSDGEDHTVIVNEKMLHNNEYGFSKWKGLIMKETLPKEPFKTHFKIWSKTDPEKTIDLKWVKEGTDWVLSK